MSFAERSKAPTDGKVVQEGPGMVTSDSLAAESIRGDGSFAEGQNASYSSQPSASTTTNNDDMSASTKLSAAPDAEARLTGSDLRGDYKTPADESRSNNGSSGSGGVYDTSRGGPQASYGGEAPSAAGGVSGLTEGQAKPKGSNLQEGGFDSDAPNASFTGDIGTRKDPSRVAEEKFEAANARAPADAAYPGANTQQGSSNQGGFENLDSSERA